MRYQVIPSIVLATLSLAAAQDPVQGAMKSIYKPFQELQYFSSSEEIFADNANEKQISDLLSALSKGFHSVEDFSSKFRTQPGFDQNVKRVIELLDDASSRFRDGKKSYALWRLRSLPSNCFNCHTAFKAESVYSELSKPDARLDTLEKVRFLLATRQFSEAREGLLKILNDPTKRLFHGGALKSLLLVHTRAESGIRSAIEDFKTLERSDSLGEEDRLDLTGWLNQLKAIAKTPISKELQSVEGLLTAPHNDVLLLLKTAMLHKGLENNEYTGNKRRRALYLLGFAYSELQTFFLNGWAALYLAECIESFPGSKESKDAFKIYKQLMIDDFTGSSGTEIPGDIVLEIDRLRKKAFLIPEFTGKL